MHTFNIYSFLFIENSITENIRVWASWVHKNMKKLLKKVEIWGIIYIFCGSEFGEVHGGLAYKWPTHGSYMCMVRYVIIIMNGGYQLLLLRLVKYICN